MFSMYEDTLAHIDLFAGLTKKELQSLGNSCQQRKFSAGTVLYSQGDTGVGLYVVTSGHIRFTQAHDPDRAEEVLGEEGPGSVSGEMALLDDLPRSATATAIDDVTALLLPVWEFRTVLHNNPDIAVKMLAALSRRLRRAEQRIHM
jgi:CRP/FNR family cyclic AMP-dependent transcriptional regulator